MAHDSDSDSDGDAEPENIEVILVVGSDEPVRIPFDDLETAREFADDRGSMPDCRTMVSYN